MTHQFENVTEPLQPVAAFHCPCCRYEVLRGRGQDEICPVCFGKTTSSGHNTTKYGAVQMAR